ncbi:MAG: NfeD family protein [Bacteroidales bacterium]|nr:NfeD family protein [Bacteroidales bacterium]MDT8431036.1 NfeD family protein [Bacteroidales bacterium]
MRKKLYILFIVILAAGMHAQQYNSSQSPALADLSPQQPEQDPDSQDTSMRSPGTTDTSFGLPGATDTAVLPPGPVSLAEEKEQPLVYVFDIKEMIAAPIWRTTKLAFAEADSLDADLVIIDMNTYGGEVGAADSIRTFLLNAKIPVYVFINDNAASAGALISIACDRIYMKPGAKIGAATVVNQSGEQVPDKFQSYMRATMRATAEAQGKDTLIVNGDTTLVWKRNPDIAEAMVDPRLFVENVIDTGQVLTFTATEAMENGYCEGIVNSIPELLENIGIEEYTLKSYEPTTMDRIIGLLINPFVSGILIMIIIGGIYFELQSPGVGFPIIAAAIAALLYFAPLYLEGLAEYWEFLIFLAGIILMLVEIFAIPGFGVAGVAGIIALVTGLALSMVDNEVVRDFEFTGEGINVLMKAFGVVVLSAMLGLIASIWTASKVLSTTSFASLVLGTDQKVENGYLGVDAKQKTLVGKTGEAYTVLRPSGRVLIDGEIYDAKAEFGYISKGEKVKILRYETGQVYVVKV